MVFVLMKNIGDNDCPMHEEVRNARIRNNNYVGNDDCLLSSISIMVDTFHG